jgi:hypothetical protein
LNRLWNYNPDNTDLYGDDWNGENFSWFSRNRALPASLLGYEQDDATLDNGGRILSSVVRPYPAKVCGVPVRFEYEVATGRMVFEWENPTPAPPPTSDSKFTSSSTSSLRATETEIYFPSHLAHSRQLLVQGLEPGDQYHYDEKRQTLFVKCLDTLQTPGKRHRIVVDVSPTVDATIPKHKDFFEVNDFWSDFGGYIGVMGVVAVLVVGWVCRSALF